MEGTEQGRLAQGNCVIYSENQEGEGDERKIFIPALRRQSMLSQHCTVYFQTDCHHDDDDVGVGLIVDISRSKCAESQHSSCSCSTVEPRSPPPPQHATLSPPLRTWTRLTSISISAAAAVLIIGIIVINR